MIYNKNIQIIDENPSIKTDLKDNEYFALMVIDLETPLTIVTGKQVFAIS